MMESWRFGLWSFGGSKCQDQQIENKRTRIGETPWPGAVRRIDWTMNRDWRKLEMGTRDT